MRFEEILERTVSRELSQEEAGLVLGVSERTFRRWRERFEAEGAEGLYDRRLGKVSTHRMPVDTLIEVLELFDSRYRGFTAKHFWDKLVSDHDFRRSYNWVRLTLQAHGLTHKAPRRGAHRRKRPRRPLPGMMLHQDGSSHEWVPGQWWDLIVTMDDATSEIISAFFVPEEGSMSCFQGLFEVISAKGLFCALYADRASHYWHTPQAGGKVDRDNPTQVGRALNQLGIELIPAYSPQARGRVLAHVRHPAETLAAGAQAGRDHHHGRGQPVPARDFPARPQPAFRHPAGGAGFGLRAVRGKAGRYPLHPGGAHRRPLRQAQETTPCATSG